MLLPLGPSHQCAAAACSSAPRADSVLTDALCPNLRPQPACRHPHLELVGILFQLLNRCRIARSLLARAALWQSSTTHPCRRNWPTTTFPFRSSFTGTYRARSIFGNNSWRSLCEVVDVVLATLAQQLEVLVRSQPSIHDHRRLTRPPGATGAAVQAIEHACHAVLVFGVAGEYFVRLGKALAIEYQTDHDLLAVWSMSRE